MGPLCPPTADPQRDLRLDQEWASGSPQPRGDLPLAAYQGVQWYSQPGAGGAGQVHLTPPEMLQACPREPGSLIGEESR